MWSSFRILLTEKCNANCPNCFNKNVRIGKEIELRDIQRIVRILSEMRIAKIKVMGGEPTIHSQFEQCMEIFQSTFDRVMLFTNAISSKLCCFRPRDNDVIDYNFNFISTHFDVTKFLLDKPGYRAFEIQIGSKTNIEFLKNKLRFVQDVFGGRRVYLFLTLDCTENIFSYQKDLIAKWNDLVEFVEGIDSFEWNLDHMIPLCFYASQHMLLKKESKRCSVDCAGLIDSNLQVRFCNQFDEIVCNFDTFANSSLQERRKMFADALTKKELVTKPHCTNCSEFKPNCNGGCFMHKCREAIV